MPNEIWLKIFSFLRAYELVPLLEINFFQELIVTSFNRNHKRKFPLSKDVFTFERGEIFMNIG